MNVWCMLFGHNWRWMRCDRCGEWRTRVSAVAEPRPTIRVHQLKAWPEYYRAVAAGAKTFEMREQKPKFPFKVGDHILLTEWDPMEQAYTGARTTVQITYVLHGGQWGLAEGWCVLAIKPLYSTSKGADGHYP